MATERGQFSPKQRSTLLLPVKPDRVRSDNKGMSYLEGYEVTAHLNRLFGFEGWDKQITRLEKIFERTNQDSSRWWACWVCTVKLTIYSTDGVVASIKEDGGTGEAQNQPFQAAAHDLAIKSAITDAVKRAAKDIGDQFGLSLYRKGSTDALVKVVIPYEEEALSD